MTEHTNLIHRIEGASAVLLSKGTYRQCDLHHFNGVGMARIGGGFVALYTSGNTSKPDVCWLTLSLPEGAMMKGTGRNATKMIYDPAARPDRPSIERFDTEAA